jgi:hypothetical protein
VKCRLLSPFEAEVFVVSLPPMRDRLVAGALRFRLGSLYPGDAESAALDYARNGGEGNEYVLLAAEASRLAAYREEAGGLPLVSPVLLALSRAPRGGSWAYLFWTRDWASLSLLEDGRLVAHRRAPSAGEPRETLRRLVDGLDPLSFGRAFVAAAAPEGELRAACDAAGLGAQSLEIGGVEDELASAKRRSAEAFPARARRRTSRRRALALLACLDLLLAVGLLGRYAAALEREGRRLEDRYLEAQRRSGASLKLEEEIAAKEKAYAELRSGQAPDMYALVSSVASKLAAGDAIAGLLAKDGEFQLDAQGRDALSREGRGIPARRAGAGRALYPRGAPGFG